MTQQELANLAGVSRQTIMQLLKNKYNLSIMLAYAFAQIIEAAIKDLFIFEKELIIVKMIDAILNNRTLFIVGVWVSVVFTILVLALLFVKSSRDERGRAIIGKASIYSTIVFIILVNLVAKVVSYIHVEYLTLANCLQWIYNIVIMVECFSIMILKKIE